MPSESTPTTVTRALRLEIASPVDGDWDALGTLLRTQRRLMPQLLRAGMDSKIACGYVSADTIAQARELLSAGLDLDEAREAILAEAERQAGEAEDDESKAARKKRVTAALKGLQSAAARRIGTVASSKATKVARGITSRGESEGTIVYQTLLAELERTRAGRWPDECRPALDLSGGMVSALAQRIAQSYSKRPSFGGQQPIPVRAQETSVDLVREDERERVVLSVLLSKHGRTRVYLRPSRGTHWHTLREIAAGRLVHGDCKIVRDDTRRKWYALLSYQAPVRETPGVDAARVLVVHRGVRNALTLLSSTGRIRYVSGEKLAAQLGHLEARMRQTRSVAPEHLGVGAKGHGKARRYEHYDALDGKRKKVIRTWCQQTAALVLRVAVEWGCGTVVIEDYGGIGPHEHPVLRRVLHRFPLYQLKQSIAQKLAKDAGNIELQEVQGAFISSTCPACGNVDEAQHNIRTNVFHCADMSCRYERPADQVAAMNQLDLSGLDYSVWRERLDKHRPPSIGEE